MLMNNYRLIWFCFVWYDLYPDKRLGCIFQSVFLHPHKDCPLNWVEELYMSGTCSVTHRHRWRCRSPTAATHSSHHPLKVIRSNLQSSRRYLQSFWIKLRSNFWIKAQDMYLQSLFFLNSVFKHFIPYYNNKLQAKKTKHVAKCLLFLALSLLL